MWEAQERAEPPLGLSSSGPESRDTRPGRSVARCALIHIRPRPPTGYTYFGGVRFGGRDSAFGPCSGVFYRACEPLADRRSRHRVLTRVPTTLQPRTAGNSMHPSNMVVRGPRAESGKAQVRPQPRSPFQWYFDSQPWPLGTIRGSNGRFRGRDSWYSVPMKWVRAGRVVGVGCPELWGLG